MINDVCLDHRLGEWQYEQIIAIICYSLPRVWLSIFIDQSFHRKFFAQKATLKARDSLTHGRWRNAGTWIWAGPSQTLVSTLSSLVRMTFFFWSAGRGAELTEGPEPPRGPQPAPYSPGRPFPLLSWRLGAVLPGVYHHSPHPPPSSLLFLHSLSCSMDPPELMWFKNSHSMNIDNEGAEWSEEEEFRLWGQTAWLPTPALLCELGEVVYFSESFCSMTEWGLRKVPPLGANVRLELRWLKSLEERVPDTC